LNYIRSKLFALTTSDLKLKELNIQT